MSSGAAFYNWIMNANRRCFSFAICTSYGYLCECQPRSQFAHRMAIYASVNLVRNLHIVWLSMRVSTSFAICTSYGYLCECQPRSQFAHRMAIYASVNLVRNLHIVWLSMRVSTSFAICTSYGYLCECQPRFSDDIFSGEHTDVSQL
ncbi:hypothetical protein DPMN_040224 [Dreissena polymorpha]|uniref:Uncharacterized protein n=1 Tax=Dreissena polymorpha TaxID=45954 RepID=A0A9D4CXA7_DREPO|nr:hypothetical protein DPMN_040224 [Dreissena polymorpha]